MGRDPGLFGPGSVTWRLHQEPILLVAGLRALYLQALHPVAVAGLAQNSGYRGDPWGRLMRTTNYIGTVVFGTTAEAEAAGERVRAIHRRMRGVDPRTGDLFRVDEPHLLRWVHVTEVESFLTTATRAGLALTAEEIDRYYAEQVRSAALVGLDPASVPASAAEITGYYAGMRPELTLTRDSAGAALFLAAPPLPHRLGLTPVRLAYSAVSALAVGLLPAWARRLYGLPGLPTTDLSASLSARTLRRVLSLVPDRVYERYRDASARSASAAR
ncbi:MAG: hypothetical protein V7603_2468 [Micromonosporaceae bacterium]|jgi:uncharacterized protein (DUF2236 family)